MAENASLDLLDLYGMAADIDFKLDGRGISDTMDEDLASALDE
ncbi:MAG: hypothetical protein AAFQ41_05250 [Cyanobacteria bacterium J06623_7]